MNTNNIHFRGEIRKIGKGVFNIKSYAYSTIHDLVGTQSIWLGSV